MKNKVFRLISMIYNTFKFSISKHRKLSIIDLFSGSSYFYAIFLISLIHSIFRNKLYFGMSRWKFTGKNKKIGLK